jgi:hypothetical protein
VVRVVDHVLVADDRLVFADRPYNQAYVAGATDREADERRKNSVGAGAGSRRTR